MLKRISVFVIAIFFGAINTTIAAEEYDVNPGMWETTYKMDMSGVPPEMAAMMQQAPKVERECVKDNNIDFSPDDMAQECSFKSTRHSANKVTWNIRCKGEGGETTGQGEVNFNGNSASGWFEMNMQGPMGPMKIRNVFEAKRIGPC